MPKTKIYTIVQKWDNEHQREDLRLYLNSLGFYVLTNDTVDALDVYVIDTEAAQKKYFGFTF